MIRKIFVILLIFSLICSSVYAAEVQNLDCSGLKNTQVTLKDYGIELSGTAECDLELTVKILRGSEIVYLVQTAVSRGDFSVPCKYFNPQADDVVYVSSNAGKLLVEVQNLDGSGLKNTNATLKNYGVELNGTAEFDLEMTIKILRGSEVVYLVQNTVNKGDFSIPCKYFTPEIDDVVYISSNAEKLIKVLEIYVSAMDGSDSFNGTLETPFKTVQKAIDKAIALQDGKEEVIIYLRDGIYTSDDITSPVASIEDLTATKLTVKAYAGETVVLSGGVKLPAGNIKKMENDAAIKRVLPEVAENIKQIDLKAMGITAYGELPPRGHTAGNIINHMSEAELIVDGKAMTLARWPNNGYALTGASSQSGKTGKYFEDIAFECVENRPAERWLNTNGEFSETHARIEVFTLEEYGTSTAHVYGVEPETGYILTHQINEGNTLQRNKRYYIYNILEELDAPGEYYLDRVSGILYFYPQSEVTANTEVFLSVKTAPVIDIKNSDNVTVENITVEAARHNGIAISQSESISIKDCEVRNIGVQGINVQQGKNVVISDCSVHDVGIRGITLDGGDIYTFEPGGNVVENCDIYAFSRKSDSQTHGVVLSGVGNKVSNTKIHDSGWEGLNWSGNEHIIDGCEFYNLCKNVADAGAIHTGRDWSNRGTSITNNYFHDNTGYFNHSINAVYFDDMLSGQIVDGNVFINNPTAICVSGGRDNIVKNNLIVDCNTGILSNLYWDADNPNYYDKNGTSSDNLFRKLEAKDNFTQLLQRYPGLYYMYYEDTEPILPKNNVLTGNVLYNSDLRIDSDAERYAQNISNTINQFSLHADR